MFGLPGCCQECGTFLFPPVTVAGSGGLGAAGVGKACRYLMRHYHWNMMDFLLEMFLTLFWGIKRHWWQSFLSNPDYIFFFFLCDVARESPVRFSPSSFPCISSPLSFAPPSSLSDFSSGPPALPPSPLLSSLVWTGECLQWLTVLVCRGRKGEGGDGGGVERGGEENLLNRLSKKETPCFLRPFPFMWITL